MTDAFILRLHSDSWILDAFQRIHSEETKFFIPYDLEISNQELSYIVKRSEQWRGINGERRKVSWVEGALCFGLLKKPSLCQYISKLIIFLWCSWGYLPLFWSPLHKSLLFYNCHLTWLFLTSSASCPVSPPIPSLPASMLLTTIWLSYIKIWAAHYPHHTVSHVHAFISVWNNILPTSHVVFGKLIILPGLSLSIFSVESTQRNSLIQIIWVLSEIFWHFLFVKPTCLTWQHPTHNLRTTCSCVPLSL